MSLVIRTLRCPCGKMHCCAYVSPISVCTCGQKLWPLVWVNGR